MIGGTASIPPRAGGDTGFDIGRMRFLPGNPVLRAGRFTRSTRLWSRGFGAITALCLLGFLPPFFSLGAAERGAPKPMAGDKCPVCGMFVSKYPDWTSAILFKDGSHVFFDGAKDMFKYLLDLKRYDHAKKAEDVEAISVKDYYRLSSIDARRAWYVLGSDVFGPMGRELIPLEKEADAKEFMKDHKGIQIIRFPDVTREVIKTLD